MNDLKPLRKFAIVVCFLPLLGVVIAQLTNEYRYSDYRYIFLAGVFLNYFFWGLALLWGLVNAIFILQTNTHKTKIKIIWAAVSLIPIAFFATICLLSVFYDPLENDIVLPGGEHISAESKS